MKNTPVASCDNLDPDTIENEAVPPSIEETYERGLVKVKINRVLVTNKTLKLVPAARRPSQPKGWPSRLLSPQEEIEIIQVYCI